MNMLQHTHRGQTSGPGRSHLLQGHAVESHNRPKRAKHTPTRFTRRTRAHSHNTPPSPLYTSSFPRSRHGVCPAICEAVQAPTPPRTSRAPSRGHVPPPPHAATMTGRTDVRAAAPPRSGRLGPASRAGHHAGYADPSPARRPHWEVPPQRRGLDVRCWPCARRRTLN